LQGQYEGVITALLPPISPAWNQRLRYILVQSAISTTIVSSGTVAASSIIQNCTLSKSSASTVTEYFPHASGSYTTRASNSSLP